MGITALDPMKSRRYATGLTYELSLTGILVPTRQVWSAKVIEFFQFESEGGGWLKRGRALGLLDGYRAEFGPNQPPPCGVAMLSLS
jgi:hypothetical protein